MHLIVCKQKLKDIIAFNNLTAILIFDTLQILLCISANAIYQTLLMKVK